MHLHMAPLALTFALLGFWFALGWAIQAILRSPLAPLPSLLLAPLIGMSGTLVCIFWLSLLGLSASQFALPATIALAGLSVLGWVIQRPSWSWNDAVPIGVAALAVAVAGVPTLVFGFDWVANTNYDWAVYNRGAIRLVEHSLLHQPDVDAMLAGKDYAGYSYFLNVGQDARPGSELMLAWLGVLTRQSPFLIFMPLILASEGVMICAAAALALGKARSRLRWVLGLILVAAAPLSLYAVQQQLMPQVLGVAFTCGLAALTCTRIGDLASWPRLALVSLAGSAYLLAYPEMVPFYGVTFVLFHATHIRDRDWGWSSAWRILTVPVGLAILTGPYLIGTAIYIASQFHNSSTQGVTGDVSIFPYFLVPSGAPTLWGFMPFGTSLPEPWLSVAIITALALTAYTLINALFQIRAGSVAAGMLLLFAVVAAQLAFGHNDFGLFKIAMFVQPLLWFTFAAGIPGRRVAPILIGAGMSASLLYTDVVMTQTSLRDDAGGGIGVAGASRNHLLHESLSEAVRLSCDVAFETTNPPLASILSAHPGCARFFPARRFFGIFGSESWLDQNPFHRIMGIDAFVRGATTRLKPAILHMAFKRPDGTLLALDYSKPFPDTAPRLGVNARGENLINDDVPEVPRILNRSDLKNHLEFIPSSLGDDYYLNEYAPVGLYAEEPDPIMPGKKFEPIGRYLLLRVVTPSPEIELWLEISKTLMAGGPRTLPPAVVMGETAASFGLVGNGSARVLSAPVRPLYVDGDAYLLLDMGADPQKLPTPRSVTMSLYNSDLSLDYRKITAFMRRISAVDAADCHCEAAPSSITDLNVALHDPTFRYSGLYEDGWIGQDGFARLAADRSGTLEFTAVIPGGIGIGHDQITISVEGGRSVTRSVRPGTFTIKVPVELGPHRISWHFGTAAVLPGGDDRSVAAKLQSVRITPEPAFDPDAAPSATVDLDAALYDADLPNSGIYDDGWVGQNGFINIRADAPGRALLSVMVPGGVGITEDDVTFTVDNEGGHSRQVAPGSTTIDLPIAEGLHKISWHFGSTAVLPNGDGRTVAALLKSVTLVKGDGQVPSSPPPAVK